MEGRGSTKCHKDFFLLFETLFLLLLDVKLFVKKQDKASKDTFFLIDLLFHSNLDLKFSHQKLKNVTKGGGGQTSAKNVSRII
jgi:hypothetical protein